MLFQPLIIRKAASAAFEDEFVTFFLSEISRVHAVPLFLDLNGTVTLMDLE